MFFTPEEQIIRQNDIGDDMFFISMGDCVVSQIDYQRKNHDVMRLLTEGDHFGEIALIYKCKRTCTIISRNYNTMARITNDRLRNVFNHYPSYKYLLENKIMNYKDPQQQFINSCIKRLPFVKKLSKQTIQAMIYCLKRKSYESHSIIMKTGDDCDRILIVENGLV